ncbi:MAG: YdcF family protein [Lachnospiraceae bacterium]|nr:YdcF family protein [Lachnospiraceae bacterium]
MSFVDEYTNFIFLEDEPEKADVIFVPGSDEGGLAVRAAELWKTGYAPIVLPSGRYGKLVGKFSGDPTFETEWEYLHHILREEGVPEDVIWKEDQATFTYENAIYSRKLTDAAGLQVKKALLCCQAFHARRARLYYQVCFPEAEILVCPVETKGINRYNWYQKENGVKLVLNEMKHCGTQFHEIFQQNIEKIAE